MTSWHSYPPVYAIGHRALADLFNGYVTIEEKIDGSQFSFGLFDDGLHCKSKRQEPPDSMFDAAVATAQRLADEGLLRRGWTYRGEYLKTPKQNVLAYARIPTGNIILFDVNPEYETYLPYDQKFEEAQRLGLECVPLIGGVREAPEPDWVLSLLDRVSILGGTKIEGLVFKNYEQFGQDKHALMGKFVSEAFKEIQSGEWRRMNPTQSDITAMLTGKYRTPARWQKAVQHLREAGELDQSPRDIGPLMREVGVDVLKEEQDAIKDALFKHFWPKIQRGITAGLPEWYKEELLKEGLK